MIRGLQFAGTAAPDPLPWKVRTGNSDGHPWLHENQMYLNKVTWGWPFL